MSEYNVDSHLISKKELLSKYGISYGALYRWKRKGLIPEEWFIKKATSTGQETFFPTALVCERIELILKQKEDILLDELAHRLNCEKESNTELLLVTAFGNKSFQLRDIKEIYIEKSQGECIDITQQVLALIEQYQKQE
jgi:hypothetical protein